MNNGDNKPRATVRGVRMTDEEHAAAMHKANLAGQTFAEFMRNAAKAYSPPPRSDHGSEILATVYEYNKAATNLRQIYDRTEGETAEQIHAAEERAQRIVGHTLDGTTPPLSAASLEGIRKAGNDLNAIAKAVNSGKPLEAANLRAALKGLLLGG